MEEWSKVSGEVDEESDLRGDGDVGEDIVGRCCLV